MCALLLPLGAHAQGFSADVERALGELEKEPSIQQTQTAALKFFAIDADGVSSMRSRAGWKSVLPVVGVKYRNNSSTVDGLQFDGASTGQVTRTDDVTGTVNEFEVSGTWDLPRLVFNPETLDTASLVVLQEAVLKEITRIYYTRRRLQVDLVLNPPRDPATKLSKELRVQELTSTLDAMTGNLFTRYERRKGKIDRRRRSQR
jgi:hypothetical protein